MFYFALVPTFLQALICAISFMPPFAPVHPSTPNSTFAPTSAQALLRHPGDHSDCLLVLQHSQDPTQPIRIHAAGK